MIFLSFLISIALNTSVITDYFANDAIAQEVEMVAGVEEVFDSPDRVYHTKSIGVVLSAPNSIVLDMITGDVLWEQNSDEVVSIASITKLVSVAVLLEQGINFSDIVTIKSQDQRPVGGNRHVYLGEQISVENLLHSVLISSDNEALMALVRYTGLSEEQFVEKMNFWVSKNNLKTLRIADPTGLDEDNVSSARDLASLVKIVFEDERIANISKKSNYSFVVKNTGRLVRLKNTNRLLDSSFNVIVGKTGFIDQAGYNFATKSKVRNNHDVITVVLGADSIANRFQDTKALLYWISENYRW